MKSLVAAACGLILHVSCSSGSRVGALHHPDLRLSRLAIEAKGSPQLFRGYQPNAPVRWSQEWTWKLDLTGVAWDKSNTATAITPRHVVMASHYIRKPGQEIVFHDRKGKRHARTIEKVVHFRERGVAADIAVGLLDFPLPGSIRTYPLPEPRADGGTGLVGAVALVTEQGRNLYLHQIAGIQGTSLMFRFDPRIPANRRKSLIVGDSGHPSFLLSAGELVLIETHSGGGPGVGPFYGSAQVVATLRSIARELDPSFPVRTVPIDARTLTEADTARRSHPGKGNPHQD